MTFPSNFNLVGVKNNALSTLNQMKTQQALMNNEDAQVGDLSELSDDLGTLRAGRFICAQSGTDLANDANGNPTLGTLTGTAMLWPGVVIGSETYTIVGANNGNLEFGLSALDGTALFAAGSGVINSSGIIMTGLYYPVQFVATNAGITRTGRLGMTLLSGSSTPNLQLDFESAAGSNLLLNSSNPTALTSWTNPGGWQAFAGDGNGTDTNCFRHDPTNATAPTLLNQTITGLTAGTVYSFAGASRTAFGYLTPRWFFVWRTSLHAVISTDTILGNSGASWQSTTKNLTAPATAAEVVIELDYGDPFQDFRYDSMSFAPSGTINQVTMTDANVMFQNATLSAPIVISNYQGARVYNNANITIATGAAATALTFNTTRYNTDTNWIVASPGRLSCVTAGVYEISVNISWDINATGVRYLAIQLNGATVIASSKISAVSGDNTDQNVSTFYSMNSGDYVRAIAYQTSGGNLNILSVGNYSPEFMIQKIG